MFPLIVTNFFVSQPSGADEIIVRIWNDDDPIRILFVFGIFLCLHVNVYPKFCAKRPQLPSDETFPQRQGRTRQAKTPIHVSLAFLRTLPGQQPADNVFF